MSLTLGKLYLFPVSIGGEQLSDCIPQGNVLLLNECRTFIVEDIRTARRFLKKIGYLKSIDDTVFYELNQHTDVCKIEDYLLPISQGENIGLLSEAGLPCIADPGAVIVKLAQKKDIEIVPLVGPSSLMLALMGSGFNGQNFAFVGYLPIEKAARTEKIKKLENLVLQQNQTQIFIETPYRNEQLLAALLNTCRESTLMCVASDLSLPTQYIKTMTVGKWKKHMPVLHKRNTVFLIGC